MARNVIAVASLLLIAVPALARDRLEAAGISNLLSSEPVICTDAVRGSCSGIYTYVMLTPTRGLEYASLLLELEPGFYLRIDGFSRFTVSEDGTCYPDSLSSLVEQATLTFTEGTGFTDPPLSEPVPDELREELQSVMALIDLSIGDDSFCNRYVLEDDGSLTIEDWVGTELSDSYPAVIYPTGRETTLTLRPDM